MNLLDILKSRNLKPQTKKAKTNEYCSPCPKCGGNDRFVIWPDENRWYCRHCDEGGNLVNFFMIIDGMNEQQALEQYFICQGKSITDATDAARLAIKKQAGDPQRTYTAIRREKKAATHTKKSSKVDAQAWLEKAAALVEWAHKQLLSNQEQLDWLHNERGLSLETVKRCKLGWNPTTLYRDRNEWGLSESLHKVTGKPQKLWIPGGLIIPGYDAGGNLARIKIRTGGDIKYVLLSGSEIGAAFYGDRSLQAFAVVESELDAILLYQLAPDLVCPVSSGSAAIRPDAAALELIGGHKCLLMLDNDDAGVKAILNIWLDLPDAKSWILLARHGKDVTEAFKNGVDVRQIVEAGLVDDDILAVTPTPEPLAERELTADEQTQLINKAYERQCNRPDPQLSALINEMESADGNNVEFMQVLIKINTFFARADQGK
jgi:DNA primase